MTNALLRSFFQLFNVGSDLVDLRSQLDKTLRYVESGHRGVRLSLNLCNLKEASCGSHSSSFGVGVRIVTVSRNAGSAIERRS